MDSGEYNGARERMARINALTSAHAINPWKGSLHGDQ
jgi:hypothetical protein